MRAHTKICCFCERWESGGIESFLNNVIQHLTTGKIQVDIVAAQLCKSIFTEPLQRKGVRFFELSGSQRALHQNYKIFTALLQEEQYNVVYLNIFHGLSLYYAKLAAQAGVPVRIAHSHNTALRQSLTKLYKLLIHRMAKYLFSDFTTEFWACSTQAAEFLFSKRTLKQQGFQLIPNGIDTERFRFQEDVRTAVRNDLGLSGKFVIGNVGRLCCQKNQLFLLEVFAEISKRRPNSRLLLIGEGDDLAMLQERTKQLKLENAVIFYGAASHVERLLWAMDVFIFPSLFEGLGIAAVEAQASGLIAFCSKYVPMEAAVTPLFHTLDLEDGPAEWGQTLLKWKGLPVERQNYAKEVCSSGFDIKNVARKIEAYWTR